MATKPQLSNLADRSSIVFVGTVKRLGASTVATHAVTSHTITAFINRGLRVPPALGKLAGQQITIELKSAPGLRVGKRAIFFTNALIYADTLVVEEVGRINLPDDPTAGKTRIKEVVDSIRRQPTRQIRSRLASADVVVSGKVIAVRKPPAAEEKPISEHDPDWREAIIQVHSTESGLPMKRVSVLFPASKDVRWYAAPKFQVNQQGTWILHQHSIRSVRAPGYTALHPADFHPKQKRNQIRAIIRGRR